MDLDRARTACASRCRHAACTGRGELVRWAHRCQLVDVRIPLPTCAIDGCTAEAVGLLPRGWLCGDHRPAQPQPDPTRTVDGLAALVELLPWQLALVERVYGEATTDPLGRSGPLNQYRIPTRRAP